MRALAICILVSIILASRASSDRFELSDLSDLAGWDCLSPDPGVTFEGLPAPKWEQSSSPRISTKRIPHDWVRYNSVRFALNCNKATGGTIVLVLGSDTPKSPDADYFVSKIKLDWTGWKSFAIPYTDFTIGRCPVGFSKIDSITFAAEGWDLKPDPQVVLHLADLHLGDVPSPGISDEALFGMMDLDRPGLEKVKAATDLTARKHEFAEYLRHREKPMWLSDWRNEPKRDPDPSRVDTTAADKVLAHELWSCSYYQKFEGEIDWTLDPINYREWPWQLNRHQDWVNLDRAYRRTGDEKYAREFVSQLMDWLHKCPVPTDGDGNWSHTWRTIEAGIRAGQTWMDVYHNFLISPSFTDDAIVGMVKSFAEHARHLMKHPTTGNWLTMEMNGLMHVGVMFPEFRESPEWREFAAQKVYEELDRQVYPDGAQIELSTGYHHVSLGNLSAAWQIAHLNGVEMPADYVAKIERMYDYDLNASMPGGTLPGLNDAGRTDIKADLAKGLTFYPDRKDLEWVATDGKSGVKPSVGSIALPFAGQLVMRAGWDADDLYLLMDAGPFGYGHQHEDALSFVIYSQGKYHLVDAGNYPYDSSEWRKYVLSTRSHNTIRVDGQDQHRGGRPRTEYVVSKPLPNKWIGGDGFDYACGMYSNGYGPTNEIKAVHSRHIFFVKPEYWIVTDFLTPQDDKPHHYDSMFHLDSPSANLDWGTKSVVTQNTDSNLTIIPLADDGLSAQMISGQEKPIVQGWMPAGGYDVRPIPTAVYIRETSGPTSFAYVFFPIGAGKECPILSVEKLQVEPRESVGLTIRFTGGRMDYYVQSDQPGGKLRFLDFETDAQAAHIRVDPDGTVKALLAGGTKITRGGKPIAAEVRPIQDLSQTEVRHRF